MELQVAMQNDFGSTGEFILLIYDCVMQCTWERMTDIVCYKTVYYSFKKMLHSNLECCSKHCRSWYIFWAWGFSLPLIHQKIDYPQEDCVAFNLSWYFPPNPLCKEITTVLSFYLTTIFSPACVTHDLTQAPCEMIAWCWHGRSEEYIFCFFNIRITHFISD